ncbi:MAG TPA: beta-ketoacyl-ACP synthase II, partial [Polyangiales bacterium]|nr:beta-ketoacyl-ACP synthase II [Polyangiales bacterium]
QVPRDAAQAGGLDLDAIASAKERRRLSEFQLYALAATQQALDDAGWQPQDELARERTGVMIGSGIGGLDSIADNAIALRERGPRRVSPFFIPTAIVNEASGVVAIRHGLQGPNHAVATACSTGTHAIGDAARMIALDDADVMIAGGSEAALSRLTLAGFAILQALSTGFNDAPEQASRPWDRARDGFVLGEGAGIVVLEEREHALRRGATIHAELLGYGMSGDAHHITAPAPDGRGALRAMKSALARARIDVSKLDYVNAHATSTPVGDPIEARAVRELCGAAAATLSMSSTKSAIGHLLGAAGAVEAIFSILALRDQVAPPTLNLHEPCDVELDLVPLVAKSRRIRHALSNSFAFGGANAALVFGRP